MKNPTNPAKVAKTHAKAIGDVSIVDVEKHKLHRACVPHVVFSPDPRLREDNPGASDLL